MFYLTKVECGSRQPRTHNNDIRDVAVSYDRTDWTLDMQRFDVRPSRRRSSVIQPRDDNERAK